MGVQSVSADDDIEGSGCCTLEGHLDVISVVGQGCDRVAQDVLDIVPARLVHDPGQVAPHDLDVIPRHPFGHRHHRGLDRALAGADK